MTAEIIDKYKKYRTAELKSKAIRLFNSWIRKRDSGLGCISCGSLNEIQAGHFYAAGHYEALRFNEDNVNSQCLRCNYFLRGNLIPYRLNLIKKIGVDAVERLDFIANASKKNRSRVHDRFTLIEIIEKYKK